MLRVQDRDRRAFRSLVERHLAAITAFAGRLLGNPADAEDVAQDVFLKVWNSAGKWQPTGAKFTTWLYRVAHNLCIDRLRRRRETALDTIVEPEDPRPGAAEAIQRDEVARLMANALNTLPERQRGAIVLCHYQGLGNKEAATVLDISVEALESLLARGRRTLRQRLEGLAPAMIGDGE